MEINDNDNVLMVKTVFGEIGEIWYYTHTLMSTFHNLRMNTR